MVLSGENCNTSKYDPKKFNKIAKTKFWWIIQEAKRHFNSSTALTGGSQFGRMSTIMYKVATFVLMQNQFE